MMSRLNCSVVLVAMVTVVMPMVNSVHSAELWSENFEGFSPGDLPSQDSSWSDDGAGYTDIVTGQAVEVGGSFGGQGTGTWVTKDLTGEFTPTGDLVRFEWNWYHDLVANDLTGDAAYVYLTDSDNNKITALIIYENLSVANQMRWGGDYGPMPSGTELDWTVDWRMDLDFGADQAELFVDDVSWGVGAFDDGSFEPGDLARLRLFVGSYRTNGTHDRAVQWDNFVFSSLTDEPSTPGDFNNDGTVNAQDYVAWRDDPDVEPDGYNVWRANFGKTAQASSNMIPEPSSATLLYFACAVSAWRRFRTGRSRCLANRD